MSIRLSINRSWGLLRRKEKGRVVFAIVLQILLNFLDIVGVLALSLTTYVVSNGTLPNFVVSYFPYLPDSVELVPILVACTIALFTAKGILAPLFYSKIMKFLSDVSVATSMSLTRKFFSTSSAFLQRFKSQDSIYSLSQGVTSSIVEILGSTIILVSEAFLLLTLLSVMFYANWVLCLLNFALFGATLFLLHRIVGKKVYENSNSRISSVIAGNSLLIDVIDTFREIVVQRKLEYFLAEFQTLKMRESVTYSRGQVLNIIPKYIFEVIFYLGAGGILLFLYKFSDQEQALTLFVLFTTSGSRMLPSILRIQASMAGIRAGESLSDRTFSLIQDLSIEEKKQERSTAPHSTAKKRISIDEDEVLFAIDSLKFSHPDKPEWKLDIEYLEVRKDIKIALVGPSGAGKSTLVDLVLGVLKPDDGIIIFPSSVKSSRAPSEDANLAYMPQQISILNRSIRENVALGVSPKDIDDLLVANCLEISGLSEFINTLPKGMNEILNEKGSNLSGGQKQRLGFARAIYQKPSVLILDESTSSLDSESEFLITKAIDNLDYKISVISIAHRLSTIRDFDLIIYMEDGRIIEMGTFQEVRTKSSSFNLQAERMGL